MGIVGQRIGSDSHNGGCTGYDLCKHHRADRFCICSRMGIRPDSVNEFLGTRNIAAGGAKRFGECAHENVNVPRVDAKVVAHAASIGTNRTNGVSFVDIEVELGSTMVSCDRKYGTDAAL